MQNVSMQLVDSLQNREDAQIETIIMWASWKFIRLKTLFFLITLAWRIPAKVKKYKPDVVLFSSMVTASIVPLLLTKKNVPFVTINHGQDVTFPLKLYQWYVTFVFKHLDGVISVSSATRKASIERGMEPEKGVALPNGFDMKVMEKLPEKNKARQLIEKQFNLDLSERKLLLSVGRQVKRKGYSWFVDEVFDGIKSDAVYLIVGDGPEREKIEKAKEKSDKKEKIVIVGKQPGEILNACYAAADLFIMPNIPVEGDMEGFGIVLLEANRAGVPAIASDLEGIKDVIEEGVNGYKISYERPDLFAQKIDYVLEKELDEMSEKSKDYVQKHYNWGTVVDQYIAFLKRVVNRASG